MTDSADQYSELSNNREIATLLSRLAGLKGVAVPVLRFDYPEATSEGVDLADLSFIGRLEALWLLRFPAGKVSKISLGSKVKSKLPVFWVSHDSEQVLLIRGVLASKFISERSDGTTVEMTLEDLDGGDFFEFSTQDQDEDVSNDNKAQNFTAKDWFIYAVKKRKRVFLEAVFATFVMSSLGLMSALYTMQVYDRVVPTKGFSTLWVLTFGVLLAILFEFCMKVVRAHMVDRASKAIDIELSSVFFEKALNIRADARPKTVGTFASQIRHFESIRNFMTSSTLFILADAPFAFFFIGIIYILAGPVAFVPLLVMPVGLLIGLSMRKPIERYTAEHMEESNKKNGLLIEAIDGIESIKAASAEWKLADRWSALTRLISTSEIKSRSLTAISTSSAQSIQQLSYVGIIAVGAYAISNGDLTMGGLIACSIISGRALTPLNQVPNLIVQWKHAKIPLDVLDGIMALPDDNTGDRNIVPDTCLGAIVGKEVVFGYEENSPGIEVKSVSLGSGERIAVLGAVGSGKSTLLKLLAGLYQPKSGSLLLDDVDMRHLAKDFVREHIGYLPQEVRLFNGSLRENLVLGLPVLSDTQILMAAELTGLGNAIKAHPKGLDIQISEGGRGLSGGQRQLVGLTRLLLARPAVLVLDEPTASMDAALENRVMDHLFKELDKATTVVIATHKLAVLKHVDRIMMLENGRVVLDGPKDKVIEHLNNKAKA